ncbi:hypothetical protein ACFE04_018615 [Oxalis oulophora]
MGYKKLHGSFDTSLSCRSTMRVLASIYEHDIEFDFIPIDLNSGDNYKDPFLSLSPFGDIPVFPDEDLTIFGSRAIMRYISHQYAKPGKEQVFEDVPKLQAMVANWIDIEDHQFDPPATKLITELVDKPKMGLKPDQVVLTEETKKLVNVLDIYEERLKESKYLGAYKFTSADLTHLPNLYYLMGTPLKHMFDDRPCVSAWATGILARPAWSKTVTMVITETSNAA